MPLLPRFLVPVMTSVLRLIVACLFTAVFAVFTARLLYAQENSTENTKPANSKKESPKKGQNIDLEGDRFLTHEPHPVRYAASYYYGNADKETTPVLVLHGEKGSRRDFMPLTDLLVNNGYAVLAPDLRGHGKSNKRYEITPPKIEMKTVTQPQNNKRGNSKTMQQPAVTAPASKKLVDYLVGDFQPADYTMMFKADLPLMRNMLERVHTDGLVNLNRLVIVGAGRGCVLAAYQALQDWQGKDSDRFTKTLVLIAPANPDSKTNLSAAFANNRFIKDNFAVLFAVPEDYTASKEVAKKIQTALLEKSKEEDAAERFPIITYPANKKAKGEKNNEETVEMSISEILGSGGKLGQKVFQFIDKRNQSFGDKENRWTKLK